MDIIGSAHVNGWEWRLSKMFLSRFLAPLTSCTGVWRGHPSSEMQPSVLKACLAVIIVAFSFSPCIVSINCFLLEGVEICSLPTGAKFCLFARKSPKSRKRDQNSLGFGKCVWIASMETKILDICNYLLYEPGGGNRLEDFAHTSTLNHPSSQPLSSLGYQEVHNPIHRSHRSSNHLHRYTVLA
ncbi:hypothetical protein VTL71DRAFT_1749 [Oculimacula yallundae]|uniref:Uncharacterized protein n=1 Tax=Oculimacula yallundae TaxID=86028 RepID=A0ABR4CBL6_9HELO